MAFLELLTDGGWEGLKRPSLTKICHTYPTMMKLGNYTLPKEDPKIWIMWHTPWILCRSGFFHRKSANFAISRNTDIDCILTQFQDLITFFDSLKIVLINMVTILMMSTKLATLGLLKIKVFWNKFMVS